MKHLFKLRQALSGVLLLLLVHLCLGVAWAQQPGSLDKGVAGSVYAQLVAQIGHEAPVKGIAFSPDGSLLLTASSDAAVLWEVATGRELRHFLGKLTQVEPFSYDARYVMTAYEQYTGAGDYSEGWHTREDEHLFDTVTGREISFTSGDSRGFWAVAISPDNRLVVTADIGNNTVRIWDVATRRQLKQFAAFEGNSGTKAIGFSKDGRFLITLTADSQESSVRLWELTTGREHRSFAGEYLTGSSNGRYLATRTGEGGHLWERETGKEIGRFDWSSAAIFSPDSSLLATSNSGYWAESRKAPKVVRIYEATTLKELRSFAGETASFSPDGRFLLTVSDNTARVWDINTGQERRSFNAEAAEFSPDGRYVIATNNDRYSEKSRTPARLWDISTGAEVLRFEGYPKGIQVARFSPDGRFVATADGDEQSVRLWDIAARREIRRFEGNFLSGNFEVARDNRFLMTRTSRRESKEVAGQETSYETYSSMQLWDLSAGQEVRRLEFKVAEDLWLDGASFSPDGRSALVNDGDAASLKDLATGQETRSFKGTNAVFLPDGRFITTSDKAYLYLWSVATGKEVRRFKVYPSGSEPDADPSGEHFIAFSSDGGYGIAAGKTNPTPYTPARLWNLKTGQMLRALGVDGEDDGWAQETAVFAPDNRSVLIGTGLFADGGGPGTACLYSVPSGTEIRCFNQPGHRVNSMEFSADGRLVLVANSGGTANLWNTQTGSQLRRFIGTQARFSPDNRFVLTRNKNIALLWDAATGKELHRFEHPSEVGSIDFIRNGRIALTASGDSSLRLWDTATGLELCRLVSFDNGDWVVITPDGRFDTNNLDEIKGLHWVTSDAPFTTLPLEIFMRQYYEPRLLPRIIAGEKFNAVPSLADLNRVQPKVEITKITKPDADGRVSVTVEVGRAKSETQRDAKGNFLATDVYDLRLFRDGQLVGYAPKEGREVRLDAETGKAVITFADIRLPRKPDVRQVEFSAYAFNVAQVKSATHRKTFELPNNLPPRKGRAYVISIGVNAYENTTFDLSFAANDARRLQRVVSDRLAKTGDYAARDLVSVQLISDYEMRGTSRIMTERAATKRNFQAVLELLSGKEVDPQLLKEIPGADKIERARPEDLVLISFSSHGYAVPNGDFYFILSDTGPGTEKVATPELLRRAVSSEELSLWLRDVDAGEMVLVVDACQSTAVVERQGFKPGPMDSRGLGQLSYDKSMRILTATQADNVALENSLVQQGLLTYALVQDGLEAMRADFKPRDRQITLSEWLAYGVERVPKLYEEMMRGRLLNDGKGIAGAFSLRVLPDKGNAASSSRPRATQKQPPAALPAKIQQPSLFDFARKRRDLVLVRS